MSASRLGLVPVPLNESTFLSNPLNVPVRDGEFLWNQIVDVVDDYFQIKSEQRPTVEATHWLEGKLETVPQIGSTYLEPWRKDAMNGFQRWESTLQTIRRIATVRVVPVEDGFNVFVEVIKEIEEVDRSLYSSEGSAAKRHDGTVVRVDNQLQGGPVNLDWIRLENDQELEQRILREIIGRATNVRPPRNRLLSLDALK
jgi:hypothetical protein